MRIHADTPEELDLKAVEFWATVPGEIKELAEGIGQIKPEWEYVASQSIMGGVGVWVRRKPECLK